jgi:hypothetical protein
MAARPGARAACWALSCLVLFVRRRAHAARQAQDGRQHHHPQPQRSGAALRSVSTRVPAAVLTSARDASRCGWRHPHRPARSAAAAVLLGAQRDASCRVRRYRPSAGLQQLHQAPHAAQPGAEPRRRQDVRPCPPAYALIVTRRAAGSSTWWTSRRTPTAPSSTPSCCVVRAHLVFAASACLKPTAVLRRQAGPAPGAPVLHVQDGRGRTRTRALICP